MHNRDYALLALVTMLALFLTGCTPYQKSAELWNKGWCGPMSGTPQTDL